MAPRGWIALDVLAEEGEDSDAGLTARNPGRCLYEPVYSYIPW